MKHIDYYLDVVQKCSGGGGTGGITPSGTKEISITENGERTEDVTQYANAHIVVDVPVPDEPTGTMQITTNGTHDVKAFASANVQVPIPDAPSGKKAISITENGTTKHDVTEFAEAEVTVNVPQTGITPSGVKEITSNGTHDVTEFAQAKVNVPVPEAPSGVKEISVKENGVTTHDVADFAQAKVTVAVPEPTGEKAITTNGKHDVKSFASVDVNVPVGVNPSGTKEINITQNGSVTDNVRNFENVKVNVNVPTGGGGVPQEKYDSLLDVIQRKIGNDFTNDEIYTVGKYAFARCDNLTGIHLPKCNAVQDFGLAYCNRLETIDLPECTTLGESAFKAYTGSGAGARYLKNIHLPKVTEISQYCFDGQDELETVKCESCIAIRRHAFVNSTGSKLKKVDILGGLWFEFWANNVQRHIDFIIRADKLTSAGQLSMPKDFTIYVPDALVEQYKTATNWSKYADKIKPLSEYVEEV